VGGKNSDQALNIPIAQKIQRNSLSGAALRARMNPIEKIRRRHRGVQPPRGTVRKAIFQATGKETLCTES
jgi:hypothetical protein